MAINSGWYGRRPSPLLPMNRLKLLPNLELLHSGIHLASQPDKYGGIPHLGNEDMTEELQKAVFAIVRSAQQRSWAADAPAQDSANSVAANRAGRDQRTVRRSDSSIRLEERPYILAGQPGRQSCFLCRPLSRWALVEQEHDNRYVYRRQHGRHQVDNRASKPSVRSSGCIAPYPGPGRRLQHRPNHKATMPNSQRDIHTKPVIRSGRRA